MAEATDFYQHRDGTLCVPTAKGSVQMHQLEKANEAKASVLSDNFVLKKMRMIRNMNRNEAALIFSYSRSSIEKLENGRAKLTPDRTKKFVEGYGFTWNQFMELKLGKKCEFDQTQSEPKRIRIIEHVELRRSYKKVITKEVQVLTLLRKRKGLNQREASRLCGWYQTTIGHIEQGRIELTENKINHILTTYGISLKEFYDCLRSDINRNEIEMECIKLIQSLDDKRLLAVRGILEKF